MQGAPDGVRLSYEDLLALPDDGLRHELIDGEHFVTPAPRSAHQLISGNLYQTLRNHLRDTAERPAGVVLYAPFDVVFTPHDVVEPDLVYFTAERFRQVVTDLNAQGPPNLAIEIMSPSTRRRDEVLKRRLYERMGVGEYWIVDPESAEIKVHRLAGGSYQLTELSRDAHDVLETPLLPALRLPLSAVFELP